MVMSSNPKNILFRADSSSTIGTGHIMRDLVLATQYPNDNIVFAAQDLNGNINHKIIEAGYEIKILESNEIKELDKLIKQLSIDLLVIDHYGIDFKFEEELKIKNPRLKILSFDDTYERHNCDILLNHNISANAKKYKKLVPKHCELRCGSKYTLLRDEFLKEKKKKRKVKSKNCPVKKCPWGATMNIFVAMGGADSSNLNPKILKVLQKFSDIKVNLITTTANQNLSELKKCVKDKKWVELHIDSNKVAKLMRKADMAIVTPSVIANETHYMEVPFIAIKVAKNQQDIYKYLKKNKYDVLSEFKNKKLVKLLTKKGLNEYSNK